MKNMRESHHYAINVINTAQSSQALLASYRTDGNTAS